MAKFRPGDQVTGVPGRGSHGWHGVVKEIVKPERVHPLPGKSGVQPPSYETVGGYRVHFRERAESEDKLVAKSPIIFMREEQLTYAKDTIEARQASPAPEPVEAGEAPEAEDDLTIGVF